jgi:N,N'-diacetylchitobiose transport system permease protein
MAARPPSATNDSRRAGHLDQVTGAEDDPDPAVPSSTRPDPAPAVAGNGRAARIGRLSVPYLLLVPSLLAFALLLAYPVFLAVRMSFEKLGLGELVRRQNIYIGLDNYRTILTSPGFWQIALRTVVFTAANVGLTMLIGTLIAHLLQRLGSVLRLAVSLAMVLAWATPVVTGVVVWQWLFDSRYGVVNWLLSALGLGDYSTHSWFTTGFSTFAVITVVIVWQAVPFVAFSLQAGLLSIPREVYEAARMDGAGAWRTFRSITMPILRPIFVVLAFLSFVWDFRAFTQVYTMRQGGPDRATVTLPVYLYQEGIAASHYGVAAAVSVLMIVLLGSGLAVYVRLTMKDALA